MRRAAVTGLGAVTGCGLGVERFFARLLGGGTEVRHLDGLRRRGLDIGPMAVVPGPLGPGDDGEWLWAPSDRVSDMACHAVDEALASAGGPTVAAERLGVCLGTTLGSKSPWLGALRLLPEQRTPLGDFGYATPARAVARRVGAGRVRVVSTACASGNAAIGAGLELIRRDLCDVVLCGGVDALQDFVVAGFAALRAHARQPCQPFDVRRAGLNLGEGAGFLVLEAAEHARARGQRARAYVDGFGVASDANHMTGPDRGGQGTARSMRVALRDAGAEPDEIGFVSLHGTGTIFNDAMEARGLREVLGERAQEVPVNSIKGCIGHTLGAAGVLEAVMIVRALEEGQFPPTAGHKERDPEIELNVVAGAAVSLRPAAVLSTSSGFGGINAAVVLRPGE